MSSKGNPETRRRAAFCRKLRQLGATPTELDAAVELWEQHRRRVLGQRAASVADWHRRHPGVRRQTAELVVVLRHQAAVDSVRQVQPPGAESRNLPMALLAQVRAHRADRRAS